MKKILLAKLFHYDTTKHIRQLQLVTYLSWVIIIELLFLLIIIMMGG